MLSGVRSSRTARRADTAKREQAGFTDYTIQRYKRFWEVRAPSGELVCLTVYKRGAKEVVRRLCA